MCVRGIPGGISWDVRIEGQEDGASSSAAAAASVGTPMVGGSRALGASNSFGPGGDDDDGSDRKRPKLNGHPSGETGFSTPGPAGRSRDGSLVRSSASPARGHMNMGMAGMQTPGLSVPPSTSRRPSTNRRSRTCGIVLFLPIANLQIYDFSNYGSTLFFVNPGETSRAAHSITSWLSYTGKNASGLVRISGVIKQVVRCGTVTCAER
jgi:hypothetical protein